MSDSNILSLMRSLKVSSEKVRNNRGQSKMEANIPESKLRTALQTMTVAFTRDICPPGNFVMDRLQCIRYDPTSAFSRAKGASAQRDQWWSRIQYKYELGEDYMTSDVISIHGVYMDLMARSGDKQSDYAKTYTNCYVPNEIVARFVTVIEENTECTVFTGKEIVDDDQQLTSYACNHVGGNPATITLYKASEDEEGNPMEYSKETRDSSSLYGGQSKGGGCILGGVGFFHVSANTSTPPDTAVDDLAEGSQVTMKFKLISFHALGVSTSVIDRITYKRKEKPTFY